MRVLAILLLCASTSAADNVPMTTLPTAELGAMKDRNDTMYVDNFILARQVEKLAEQIHEQERIISSQCGRYLKAIKV